MPLYTRKNSLRLKGYDYSQAGAYFVTICTYNRIHLFGEVEDGEMRPSKLGAIVAACWMDIPTNYPRVELADSVIMPNHLHGILILHEEKLQQTLSRMVASYKGAVTHHAKQTDIGIDLETPVWQRNFHDRIIRNEHEYGIIAAYIENNPALWEQDKFYETGAS
ncbi:MAG: transposase [Anaerolineaceae bacterium]|nr:transposase [Anaerolineaceae bacterium]